MKNNWKQGLLSKGRAFASSRDGNILITSALALPVVIGMVALSVEYGGGLMKRVENQRVADLAAYAAATAYGAKSTETAMQNAAYSVARLNGLDTSKMTVALVNSPRTSGSKAVKVNVATQQNLYLARVLGDFEQLQVKAAAMAEVGSTPSQPGCVYALSSSESGITMSGGTQLNAPNCAVSSNTTVTVPCGTKITTTGANYNTTVPSQPCTGIVKSAGGAAPIIKQATTDPLAGNSAVATAVSRLTTVANMTSPTFPTSIKTPDNKELLITSGSNITFAGWNDPAVAPQVTAAGCTATWDNMWKVVCPTTKKIYNFGTITMGGGAKVEFSVATPYQVVNGVLDQTYFNFANGLTLSGGNAITFGSGTFTFNGMVSAGGGSQMKFGNGTFNFAKGLASSGGSTLTIGAGSFRIGRNTSNCGSSTFSLCNDATLTIAGPSTFDLDGGVYNGGGATMTMGSGTLNSYRFGAAANGNSIQLGGGSKVTMADATGVSSKFEMGGNFVSEGGSCFTIPAAAYHDIKGALRAAGGTVFGSGVYTITDFLSFGANGGGSVWCTNANVAGTGVDVNFVIGGNKAPTSGSCNGFAFCVAAGYSGLSLAAPKTGTLAKLLVVGPTLSNNTKGATFAEGGSSGVLAGVFYFPYGPITMSGGASAGGSNNYCLQLIGSRITLGGGTTATSECIASGGSTAAKKVVLVQ